MPTINIHDITYDVKSGCIDYRASVAMPGSSISIVSRARSPEISPNVSLLYRLALAHAKTTLGEPSAAGCRLSNLS